MSYDWIHYYKTSYELQKRENTVMAGKVADAEAKRDFLQGKLQKIEGNICYKMLKPLKIGKRAIKWLKNPYSYSRNMDVQGHEQKKQLLKEDYQKRLEKQADSYKQWILEEESAQYEKIRTSYPNRQVTVKVISYEDTLGIENGTALADSVPENTVFLFAENPGWLDEHAIEMIERYFTGNQDLCVLYGGEDQLIYQNDGREGERKNPWFKPCWSENTLLGYFYFGSYFAVKGNATAGISWKKSSLYRKNIYDFCLNVCKTCTDNSQNDKILNCDLILYHARIEESLQECGEGDAEYFLHSCETDETKHPEYWGFEKEYLDVKLEYLQTCGYEARTYQTAHPQVWTVIPEKKEEKESADVLSVPGMVSVVIPSKDHPDVLGKCITSFLKKTLYRSVEFIIVDNGSSEDNQQKIRNILNAISECKYQYLYHPMEFNFSMMCNLGARAAKGEYILLLNDDIEIIEENWLSIMVGQAMLPRVGAVGAKLWYPVEQRIQHAGITNMHIGPSHKLVTFPDDRTYYYGKNTVTHDMLAVTAACLLIKKALYDEVGGLDESMKVAYNDVDFCFKLYEKGYHNVIRNDAVLLHHESLSRGLDEDTPEKWQRLLKEKRNLYEKHPSLKCRDPYYSDLLVGNAPDYRIGYMHPFERPLLCVKPEKKTGKRFLEKCLEPRIMLTVERAILRHKIHMEEPDIYFIEGWCYVLSAENSQFKRHLVLESEGNADFYYVLELYERNRPDVKAILPQQKDIELSGFTSRILKEDLTNGKYTVGILYQNSINDTYYYQRSNAKLQVQ